MGDKVTSTKRLMVNTIILYFRMFVVMGVSFYTTRVLLKALGVVDFGLTNVIAGVVGMFSFMSVILSSSCARYFSYELGRKDEKKLNQVFSLFMLLFVIFAIGLFALSESAGLWYLNNKLVFPSERMNAVFWFFQFTAASVIVGWLAIPYNALAVSYENMSLYSWLSIIDAVIKLLIAFLIQYARDFDLLIVYGLLLLIASIIHALANVVIVRFKYPVSKLKWYFNKKEFREICVFSGWSFWGVFVWMTSDALVNLLLNSFFGPIVNAARAISMQVNNGVSSFTTNLFTAARPQLVKAWASGNLGEAWSLYKRITKLGYFLMFTLMMPLCFELPKVLSLWLGEVPEYTVVFTQIILVTTIVNSFSHPAGHLMQAIGKLAIFEGIGSGIRIFTLPVSYICLRMGAAPSSVFLVALFFSSLCTIIRVLTLLKVARFSIKDFMIDVTLRLFISSVICLLAEFVVHQVLQPSWLRLCITGVTSVALSLIIFLLVGLNCLERGYLLKQIRSKIKL